MKDFARLLDPLFRPSDAETSEAVLARYFQSAAAEDAAWALHLLAGGRVPRSAASSKLLEWVSEAAGIAPWLAEACARQCGDTAEAAALLAAGCAPAEPRGLAAILRDLQAAGLPGATPGLRDAVLEALRATDPSGRYWLAKLVTGGFRPGLAPRHLANALASVASLPASEMAWRLSRGVEPSPDAVHHLLRPGTDDGPGLPYDFQPGLALNGDLESLGAPCAWHAMWLPEGARVQVLRRNAACLLWSEAGEGLNTLWPGVVALAERLPPGTVLEAHLSARRPGEPEGCVVTDLLELGGRDLRGEPLRYRLREMLPLAALAGLAPCAALPFESWQALRALHATAEEHGADGIVLRPFDPAVAAGSPPPVRLEWRTPARALHLVLAYAQPGCGGACSAITLGAWSADRVVPVCKVESGLPERQQEELDRYVAEHTLEKFGPVRSVPPEAVFRVECDGVRVSTRHKSGITLRNPRVVCRLIGMPAAEAMTLDALRARAQKA